VPDDGEGRIEEGIPVNRNESRAHRSKRSIVVGWLCAAAIGIIAASGCGNGLVPAEGVVLLDGQPIAGATVTLMPQGAGRPASAVTGPDGRFSASLPDAKQGVPPGDYRVAVMLVRQEVLKPSGTGDETSGAGGGPPVEYVVPRRYGNPETSGLTASLPGGGDGLRFELDSKPDPVQR